MKRIFNIKTCVTYFLIASLAFVFISCKDDDMFLTYFRCQVNGKQYKTPNPSISFSKRSEPVLIIDVDESTTTCRFYTTINPEDENSDNPTYFLAFKIYRKEPLKIGEVYFISELSEEVNSGSNMDMESILKDYVYISPFGDSKEYLGSGNFQLIEYNDKENWYKGVVEFEFELPIEKGGKNGKSILKGEFCAVVY